MKFIVKQVQTADESKQYYHLRWQILRRPWQQPEGSEKDDLEDQATHFIVCEQDSANQTHIVVAVARLQFNSTTQAQIRYMAVAESHRNQGVGTKLMLTIEQFSLQQSCPAIVLDARDNAVTFYRKLGYKNIKKSYLLFDEIQHYRMSKKL